MPAIPRLWAWPPLGLVAPPQIVQNRCEETTTTESFHLSYLRCARQRRSNVSFLLSAAEATPVNSIAAMGSVRNRQHVTLNDRSGSNFAVRRVAIERPLSLLIARQLPFRYRPVAAVSRPRQPSKALPQFLRSGDWSAGAFDRHVPVPDEATNPCLKRRSVDKRAKYEVLPHSVLLWEL